jgi:hypothetical protein
MDGDPGEFNLLLPLFLGLIVFIPIAFAAIIYWLLIRFKVIEFSNKNFPFKIVKGVALSFGGVFAFLIIFNIVIFVIEALIRFFKK